MIALELQRLCKLRGIPKAYSFLRVHGFSHPVAHKLANGTVKRLDFAHLEKLCRIFHCLPHDLYTYKPVGRGIDPSNDVLLPLRKEPVRIKGLNSLIASLPPNQVIDLAEELQARFTKPANEPLAPPPQGPIKPE